MVVVNHKLIRSIKWVENTLVKLGRLNLPGKGRLSRVDKSAILLVDVTKSPIERPQKKSNVDTTQERRKSIS